MSTIADQGVEVAQRQFHNTPPQPGTLVASKEAAMAEFGRRLQAKMIEKGWNQSDFARAASKHMPGKKGLGRDNVSNYVRGLQFPGPVRLTAILKTLGVPREELVPAGAVVSVDDKTPPLSFKSTGDGNVWLQVNQAVSMEVAMQIVQLLGTKKEGS